MDNNRPKDLKQMIEQKYGTIYKFQKESKIPASYLYQVIRGEGNPTVKFIEKLAEHLDTTKEEILNAISSN